MSTLRVAAIQFRTLGDRAATLRKASALIEQAAEMAAADRAGAIALLETEIDGRPDAAAEPWLLLWAGEQRRLGGDIAIGRSWFEQLAERFPTHPLKEPAMQAPMLQTLYHHFTLLAQAFAPHLDGPLTNPVPSSPRYLCRECFA